MFNVQLPHAHVRPTFGYNPFHGNLQSVGLKRAQHFPLPVYHKATLDDLQDELVKARHQGPAPLGHSTGVVVVDALPEQLKQVHVVLAHVRARIDLLAIEQFNADADVTAQRSPVQLLEVGNDADLANDRLQVGLEPD